MTSTASKGLFIGMLLIAPCQHTRPGSGPYLQIGITRVAGPPFLTLLSDKRWTIRGDDIRATRTTFPVRRRSVRNSNGKCSGDG
jgi:hypothetical protein